MLRKTYTVKGLNPKTNRINTKEIKAFELEEALLISEELGLTEPFEFLEKHSEPTESQIKYLDSLGMKHIPSNITMLEASYLIESYLMGGYSEAREDMKTFLRDRKIEFSEFASKNLIYSIIFDSSAQFSANFPITEKIAFFCMCVYKHISGIRDSNLDKHIYKNLFFEFADLQKDNKNFLDSLFENYSGKTIKFFGKLTLKNGDTINGGSTRTLAYKLTEKYLFEKLNIKRVSEPKNKTPLKKATEKQNNTGCLFIILLIFTIVLGYNLLP